MSAALEPLAVDGSEAWRDGQCGLVHAHHWTLPEDVGSSQPIAVGHVHAVADGRLDNRDELLRELGGAIHAAIPTDAQLIAAAYERWGETCPDHLIGDFAFVIWNSVTRELFAARDVSGVRPLFYAYVNGCAVVATTIAAVAGGAAARFAINRGVVREAALGRTNRWENETVWADVMRVPPAYSVRFEQGQQARLQRYYILGQAGQGVRRTPEHWRDEFAAVFRESVRARLRSRFKVTVLGGAGLDSSSVFCQSAALIADGSAATELSVLSGTFDSTPGADERPYLQALRARWPAHEVSELLCDRCIVDVTDDEADDGLWEPNVWLWPALMRDVTRAAAEGGAGVVLGGQGGDELLYFGVYHRPWALQDLPWSDLIREIRHFRLPARRLALGLLVGRFWRSLRRRRATGSLPLPQLPTSVAEAGYAELMRWSVGGFADRLAVAGAAAGVEPRFPFRDQRVIDLMLAAPVSARCSRGRTKLVLRDAMRGLLPPLIDERRDKASFTRLVLDGLTRGSADVKAFIESSELDGLGVVDLSRIRSQWTRFVANPTYELARPILWFCSVERWLRRMGRSH